MGWEANLNREPESSSEQTPTPPYQHQMSIFRFVLSSFWFFLISLLNTEKVFVVLQMLPQHRAGWQLLVETRGEAAVAGISPLGFLKWKNHADMLGSCF